MEKVKNQKRAYLLALLAILFWSTISSALKITLRYVAFDQMLFWSVLSGIFFLAIINLSGKNALKLKQLTKKDLLSSAIMGFFSPFMYYLILFKAYDLLEAQVAGVLNYTWPIVLVLLSVPMLGQKISYKSLFAIGISFLGILLISTQGNFRTFHVLNPLGVTLAVGSAFFWSLYWIFNMRDHREDSGKILLNMIFGLFYMVIYYLVLRKAPQVPSLKGIIGSIYVGLFEMSFTYVIWLKALNYSKNVVRVSNLIYLSPFIALFWIREAVGETIHLFTIMGLVLIILGIILQQIVQRKEDRLTERSTPEA
ncbi:MAG: DMT family transporter [Bacteroidales bacterium]|nr:DMT family transporter [Bacteroidales bacterium]